MTDAIHELTDLAEQIAREAGELVMGLFRSSDLEIDTKADGSFVTSADRSAESHMRRLIETHCPGDGIIGEEFESVASTTGREWLLDPIDGTLSFVHGVPLFSTLVAVRDDSGPLVGVINAPGVEEIAIAGRGIGCRVNGAPAVMSSTESLGEATVLTSGLRDYWPPENLSRLIDSGALIRTWADGGYGFILVASGRVEAMVDSWVNAWDVAPAECIIPEAGGAARWVDVGGRKGFVGSNQPIHDQLLAIL